jgi:uncharacterized protein YjbI with pentapeptide repeats
MKHTPIKGFQPPQMPRQLAQEEVGALADHAEYTALRLAKCDWSGQTAADVLFEQVECSRMILQGVTLTGARLFDVRATTCDFSGANGRGARFRRAEFIGCRLLGAQLLEAQLDLENVVFASAVFKAARFEGCVLRGALFDAADLRGVVFARCDLAHADFTDASLRGVDLRGSVVDGLKAGVREWQGATIDPSQAVQVAALLGLIVKPAEEA